MTPREFISEFERTRGVTIVRTSGNSVRAFGVKLTPADKALLKHHRRTLNAALMGIDLDLVPLFAPSDYPSLGIHTMGNGEWTHSLGDDHRDRLLFGLTPPPTNDAIEQSDRRTRIMARSSRSWTPLDLSDLLPASIRRVESALPRMNASQRSRFVQLAMDYRSLKHELHVANFSAGDIEPYLQSPRSSLNPAFVDGSNSKEENRMAARDGRKSKVPRRKLHHD